MWKEDEMQLIIENFFLTDLQFDCIAIRNKLQILKTIIAEGCNEMILLQDSDLYAVISYLMITRKISLNKIWVQEQIQETFLSLLNKNFHHSDFPIHVFQFKEDLLTTRKNDCSLNITSIWSENIVAAKNLAFSLNVYYSNYSIQLHIENYALNDDIKNCVDSTNKGFEIWSTMSFDSRMQVLSNFAFTLKCNSKFLLADVISRWIKGSYLSKINSVCLKRTDLITSQHKPMGVIFLKEENEITLFSRLIQSLIAGNSVIVLCDANSCNLAPYCNMFATAEIPRGVINMLPSESLRNLETFLFDNIYAEYITSFFIKSQTNNAVDNFLTFKKLTISKQIVVAIERF
nr:PREDICTED: LOW QUALITY PROTEIN: uncharacterized protein LOC105669303 [Linepithema humile]